MYRNQSIGLRCAFGLAGVVLAAAVVAQERVDWGRNLDANPQVWLRSQDGAYLDANPQVGSGGFNYRGGGGGDVRQNADIWSRQYYEVTRTGQNRWNTPTNHGQNQRYRTTRNYNRHDYHRASYGSNRTARQSTRMR